MELELQDLEKETFDPTGQGVEVVDAEFARRVLAHAKDLKKRIKAMEEEGRLKIAEERERRELVEEDLMFEKSMAEALGKECEALRGIFPSILDSIEHDVPCGTRASLDFLRSIPLLIREKLKTRGSSCDQNKNTSLDPDDADVLQEIHAEIQEFAEHPDCTLVDAIRLLKCQLAEARAENTRNSIRKKWNSLKNGH
jgi:hypothetical protein